MINHVVKGDRQSGIISSHYIGSRISHQNSVYSASIQHSGSCKVISCEHGYFLAILFHFSDGFCGYFFYFRMYRHSFYFLNVKTKIHKKIGISLFYENFNCNLHDPVFLICYGLVFLYFFLQPLSAGQF